MPRGPEAVSDGLPSELSWPHGPGAGLGSLQAAWGFAPSSAKSTLTGLAPCGDTV